MRLPAWRSAALTAVVFEIDHEQTGRSLFTVERRDRDFTRFAGIKVLSLAMFAFD